MSKRYISDAVKCPWYKSEDTHKIFCDGPLKDTSIHVAFASPEQRREYESNHCKTMGYCSCVIARAHNTEWEERENHERD